MANVYEITVSGHSRRNGYNLSSTLHVVSETMKQAIDKGRRAARSTITRPIIESVRLLGKAV